MLLQDMPISLLKGVGPKVAQYLARLEILTVQDLLFHLPARYEDRTRITTIANCRAGHRVLIEGNIIRTSITGVRQTNLLCLLQDATGTIPLRFFHFTAASQKQLAQRHLRFRCFGEIKQGYHHGLEMMHPEYQVVFSDAPLPLTDKLTPIYPTTKGLHQITLRKLTEEALNYLMNLDRDMEFLPAEIVQQFGALSLAEALQFVHRPPANVCVEDLLAGKHPAQQRLAIEELIAHHLSLQQTRCFIRRQQAPILPVSEYWQARFLQQLSFSLTSAQQRVIAEIGQDLAMDRPMLRLVQGDVGSGKTIVAAMAMLQAVAAGYQAAIMAPTEILAEQHWKNLQQWFLPLNITVGWLTGSCHGEVRQTALTTIADGTMQVIVGTHALFQEEVVFAKLALLVIDEQHRFGVHQRLALKEKGMQNNIHPHQLIMTATPIPRTLAMLAYADLDVSIIDELPAGRQPITTLLISNKRRSEVINRVQINCEQQRQAYWVCTLIDESEVLQCQAAAATAQELQQLLPQLKIGLIHGRLKPDEKDHVMSLFKNKEIDLLVATTVVEVGVDIPNASLMIIENAERLGLAQLHQLRGRVGRGEWASHCVLLYQSPLSITARARLLALRNSSDGFEIARIDLDMRGPGEVLGVRQAGLIRMRIADLIRDKDLLPQVSAWGKLLLEKYPDFVKPIIARWITSLEKYIQV